jgi:DnaD/phage-associated family protein
MTSYYWIKLYHEILDDPKMALLPDRLWRRVVELFLLAGKHGTDGVIPDSRQLAWLLRMNPDELEMDMKQIETTGIVERVTNGWVVVNFAKRQAAIEGAKRTAQHRERQKQQQYYDSVTTVKRDVTQNQINRVDTDIDKREVVARITSLYSNNFASITPMSKDQLVELCNEFEESWIVDAMQEAVNQNKRNIKYFTAILDRWKVEGKDSGLTKKNGKPARVDTRQAEIDAALKEVFGE